jgi:hypothetical protein
MKGRAIRSRVICYVFACSLLMLTPPSARAQGPFGIGLMVGEPTGISWTYHLSERNALDGALGFSPIDRLRLHVDYLWKTRAFSDRRFTFSYGGGLALGLGRRYADGRPGIFGNVVQEGAIALRFSAGLAYEFPRMPLEVGIEAAPLLILGPVAGWGIDGAMFVRYYP